jgi:C-terminal processing protease CtpA/Prc
MPDANQKPRGQEYSDQPNAWSAMADAQSGTFNFWYSLGLHVGKSGTVSDVLKGRVADKGGFGPGMKIVAVNGRAYSPDVLKATVRDGKGSGTRDRVDRRLLQGDPFGLSRRRAISAVGAGIRVPDRLGDILKPEGEVDLRRQTLKHWGLSLWGGCFAQ